MEFSKQYLTYEEYRALGGTLDLTPFNLLEYEARRQIDIRTFDRIKDLNTKEIPQEVKMCELNLINSLSAYTRSINNIAETGNVKSENIDGYSINYLTADNISSVINSKYSEISQIITNYLERLIVNNEHVLYCGVR